jgi:tetratricopeptide (TPR) repeat protein
MYPKWIINIVLLLILIFFFTYSFFQQYKHFDSNITFKIRQSNLLNYIRYYRVNKNINKALVEYDNENYYETINLLKKVSINNYEHFNIDLFFIKADSYLKISDYVNAEKIFLLARRKQPDNILVLNELYNMYLLLDETEKAKSIKYQIDLLSDE